MTVHTGTRRRRFVDLVRGLVAFVLLCLLIGAIPYVLWTAGGAPWPSSLPSVDEVIDALRQRDDGTLFIHALMLVGWFGWLTFVIAVAVELPAALRGIQAPRLPALGVQQRLAAVLVSAVVGAVALGPVATAQTHSPSDGDAALISDHFEPADPVTRDDLQDKADGADNKHGDRRAHDGVSEQQDGQEALHEVQPGDTLWAISDAYRDDPTEWPVIYEANRAVVGDDPDLIHPGQELIVPIDEADGLPASNEEKDQAVEHRDQPETDTSSEQNLTGETTDAEPDTEERSPSSNETTADNDKETQPRGGNDRDPDDGKALTGWLKGASTDDPVNAADSASEDHDVDHDSGIPAAVATAAGIGAVLAAGLIGLVGTRRLRQQRRRRSGQAIPDLDPLAAATEAELRHVADPDGRAFIDRALRSLAASLAEAGMAVPPMQAARLTRGQQLELYLCEPTDLPEPFVGTTDAGVWVVTPDADGLLTEDQAEQYPAPYPSLVVIGQDAEDAQLLLDLELLRTLRVIGDPVETTAFLTAIAAEYATSIWADDLEVTLVGHDVRLEVLDTGRVRRVSDVSHLLRELSARADADRELLAQLGADTVAQARTNQTAAASWTPEIVLIARPLTDDQRTELTRVTEQLPHVAIATVTSDERSSGEWTLRIDSSTEAVLEPIGFVRPQRLDDAAFEQIAALIAAADADPSGDPHPELSLDEIPAETEPLTTLDAEPESTAALPSPDGEAPAGSTPSGDESASSTDVRTHPRVLLLGEQPEIDGAKGPLEPSKRGQGIQLAAYLSLRPGHSGVLLDEAIWPGRRLGAKTRDTAISKLRRWLGTNLNGEPYLPHAVDTYRLHPDVRSDWQDWCELLGLDPANARIEAVRHATTEDLKTAMAMVRGRPFAGVRTGSYAWSDGHAQEMISAIVEACHQLTERALTDGDVVAARSAAVRGLEIEPASELLWRDRLRAESRLSDHHRLQELISMVRQMAEDLWGDLEDDTVDLLEQLERPLRMAS